MMIKIEKGCMTNKTDYTKEIKKMKQENTHTFNKYSMVPKNYIVDEFVKEAVAAVKRNEPIIYVAGKAGVGKSTFIHYIREITRKNCVVLAPTGIAALNIMGQTIHSFFRFPPKLLSKMDDIKNRNDEVINKLELLIIDEVSMVRADVMDCVDYSLRKWRKNKNPFGGVQVLLLGDCFQLSPVITRYEEEAFYKMYSSPWFFDSPVLTKNKMFSIEMKNIYRQNDETFIKLLHCIRERKHLDRAVTYLNKMCYHESKECSLYLTPTNAFADIVNSSFMDAITSKPRTYIGKKSGYLNLVGDKLPVPQELVLKVGARVMVKKNIDGAVNGSLGTVTICDPDFVNVELDTGTEIEVRPETWSTYTYEYNKEIDSIEAVVAGKYTQTPLVLGWAVTIHKAQGLTLDSVELDMGDGCFASGQAYVALSRCKTLEGLSLTVPVREDDVILDQRVIDFHNKMFGEE